MMMMMMMMFWLSLSLWSYPSLTF